MNSPRPMMHSPNLQGRGKFMTLISTRPSPRRMVAKRPRQNTGHGTHHASHQTESSTHPVRLRPRFPRCGPQGATTMPLVVFLSAGFLHPFLALSVRPVRIGLSVHGMPPYTDTLNEPRLRMQASSTEEFDELYPSCPQIPKTRCDAEARCSRAICWLTGTDHRPRPIAKLYSYVCKQDAPACRCINYCVYIRNPTRRACRI